MHDYSVRRDMVVLLLQAKNVPAEKQGKYGYGDVWTWTAIDADTKLVPSWIGGLRDAGYGYEFMLDLKSRLANRVQITTDGHRVYLNAVEEVFGADVDYAMLVKLYGAEQTVAGGYSPAVCTGAHQHLVLDSPDLNKISTSFS